MDPVERAAQLQERALSQSARSRFDLADRGLRRALDYLNRAEVLAATGRPGAQGPGADHPCPRSRSSCVAGERASD